MKKSMYWLQAEKTMREMDLQKHYDLEQECNHCLVEVEGYHTCSICGAVVYQIFRTVSSDNGYEFIEERKTQRTKYSQIKEIRSKFLIYVISTQKPIALPDYIKFATYWNKQKFKKVTKKNVLACLKDCKLEINDMNKYYNNIRQNKNVNNVSFFTNQKINEIISICADFIKFHKGTLKNINKRCLIFVICIDYKIYLYDYIGFMQEKIIQKYKLLYIEFQRHKFNNPIIRK